jgi:hypothetical protein
MDYSTDIELLKIYFRYTIYSKDSIKADVVSLLKRLEGLTSNKDIKPVIEQLKAIRRNNIKYILNQRK